MRKCGLRLLWGALILGCVAVFASQAVRAEKPTQTITGKIMRARTHRGETVRVYIRDAQGQSFLVQAGTPISKELRSHVGKTVAATGYVKKSSSDKNFDHMIDVLEYEIVAPADTGDVVPLPDIRAG